jgi:hypothetical protein
MVGVAGTPNLPKLLHASHKSVVAKFEQIVLGNLDRAEVAELAELGLLAARERNGYHASITPCAAATLYDLSDGFPPFAQVFAYGAFDVHKEGEINAYDIVSAGVGENGVLERIARKYYQHALDGLGGPCRDEALRNLAKATGAWTTVDELTTSDACENRSVQRALLALCAAGLAEQSKESKQEFRIVSRALALWLRLRQQTDRPGGFPFSEADWLATCEQAMSIVGSNPALQDAVSQPQTVRRRIALASAEAYVDEDALQGLDSKAPRASHLFRHLTNQLTDLGLSGQPAS